MNCLEGDSARTRANFINDGIAGKIQLGPAGLANRVGLVTRQDASREEIFAQLGQVRLRSLGLAN